MKVIRGAVELFMGFYLPKVSLEAFLWPKVDASTHILNRKISFQLFARIGP